MDIEMTKNLVTLFICCLCAFSKANVQNRQSIYLDGSWGFAIDSTHRGLTENLQRISSYGNQVHPIERKVKFHNGIDIAARYNQPVYVTADGQVIELGYQTGLGNFIKIKH